MLNVGDIVQVMEMHADGEPYRWWSAVVEEITVGRIVVVAPVNTLVHERGRTRTSETSWRKVLWADLPYNVTEVFTAQGEPHILYVDIASPARWDDNGIAYHDYELDVVKELNRPAAAVDQDEFEEAIARYGYTPEFQAACWAALDEAMRLAESWQWSNYSPGSNTLARPVP